MTPLHWPKAPTGLPRPEGWPNASREAMALWADTRKAAWRAFRRESARVWARYLAERQAADRGRRT